MPIQPWKTLSTKVIFKHPRLTLLEDAVVLPNGSQTTYLRFKRTSHGAMVIAMRHDGLILLQREYSHPPAEVLYEFPGGGVPDGEDIADGANRELMEEAGFRGELELIGTYYVNNRRTDAKMHVFVATNLQAASLPADAEEYTEHEWRAEAEIDEMIARGEFKHAHILAPWALFKSLREGHRSENKVNRSDS